MADLMIPRSEASLAAVTDERRAQAVRKAATSPYFRGKLDHLDFDRITEPEVWRQIPILDKSALREMSADEFYNGFCIAPRSAIAEYWRSGGSTGRPLFYPRTWRDVSFGLIGFRRVLACAGFSRQDITHLSLPLGIHPAGHLMGRAASDGEMGVVWAGGGNTLPSLSQLDLIELFRPTGWIGMASYALQLANLARGEGIDLASGSIDKVLCTAEPLSASKREKIEALFGARVRDSYGMTEMMMLGAEDAACNGFRFWSDYCFPEVVDPNTLEPVPDGEPGLLIATSLVTNEATPFLRWNTGDVVTLEPGEPQGSPFDVFPLVRHTHRTAGFVKVRGVNIGFTDFEDLMFRTPEVADFRVDITFDGRADALELQLEAATGTDPAHVEDAVSACVKRTFEVTPRIALVAPGTIAKSFEGSFKPVRFSDRR